MPRAGRLPICWLGVAGGPGLDLCAKGLLAAYSLGQFVFLCSLNGWLLFLAAGSCSVIAWIGIIGGYRRTAPALLAPFEYSALVGGAVAGYLIRDEIPDSWVIVGATIIIAAGPIVVYREVGSVLSTRN